jgi:hypothetical protein
MHCLITIVTICDYIKYFTENKFKKDAFSSQEIDNFKTIKGKNY